MRVMTAAVLCLLAIPLATLSTYSEPLAHPRIYFAAPDYDPNQDKRPSVLGSFKLGLNVTLLNEKEICRAKTGSAFSIEYEGTLVKATTVIGAKRYPKGFTIAVVGAAAESVRLHVPEEIQSPLPADVELKVRQYVERMSPDPESSYALASAHPQALRVGRFTLLRFKWKGMEEEGPSVLCFDDQFFEIEENCTRGHVFFSVNEKLYLAFHEGGCFNCRNCYCVYDLSGASPRRVYLGGLST